jgi:hypothetical protein
MVVSNCGIDELSIYPTYRKPFDLIFKAAKNEKLAGRQGFEPRYAAPEAAVLPLDDLPARAMRRVTIDHRTQLFPIVR